MGLSRVSFELAVDGGETTAQAETILESFKDPLYKGTLLGEGSMICVGYAGDLAVTAANCFEGVVNDDGHGDEARRPFIGLPYLEVWLIATDSRRRGQGYAKQLVDTILDLATNHEFDHVEATHLSNDDSRMFWGSCGFESLPYMSFGDYDMYRKTKGLILDNTGLDVTVSSEVNERLASFVRDQVAD